MLNDSHNTSVFASGLVSVDRWFCTSALAEQKAGRVRTHVLVSSEAEIVAFFSLKHIIVNLEGASRRMRDTADGEPGGATTGLLLAQMGVRLEFQGGGIGRRVVGYAMKVAAALHLQAAFRLMVVDAENAGLVAYYQQFGFAQLANDLRMVMKMSAVNRVVAELP